MKSQNELRILAYMLDDLEDKQRAWEIKKTQIAKVKQEVYVRLKDVLDNLYN